MVGVRKKRTENILKSWTKNPFKNRNKLFNAKELFDKHAQ